MTLETPAWTLRKKGCIYSSRFCSTTTISSPLPVSGINSTHRAVIDVRAAGCPSPFLLVVDPMLCAISFRQHLLDQASDKRRTMPERQRPAYQQSSRMMLLLRDTDPGHCLPNSFPRREPSPNSYRRVIRRNRHLVGASEDAHHWAEVYMDSLPSELVPHRRTTRSHEFTVECRCSINARGERSDAVGLANTEGLQERGVSGNNRLKDDVAH